MTTFNFNVVIEDKKIDPDITEVADEPDYVIDFVGVIVKDEESENQEFIFNVAEGKSPEFKIRELNFIGEL